MTGKEIFNELMKQRDFIGGEIYCYNQLLLGIKENIGDAIFSLLETAKKENKKLHIKADAVWNKKLTINDIELV